MRELLLYFLISANAKSVEEVLAKKLLYDAGYMKSVSPLNPEFTWLDPSHEKFDAPAICKKWFKKMKQTWSSDYEESRIANYAFNCEWEASEGWTWKKNGENDCVGWLMNIFYGPAQGWQNGAPLAVLTKKQCPGFDYGSQNVEYNGACDPKNGPVEYEDYGSTTQSSTSSATSTKSPRTGENPEQRLAYAEDLDLLDDVLTVMTSDAMKVNVEVELVSLNALELADSAMDTTIVVFSSWTDDRLKWDRMYYNDTQKIEVDPNLIWTPPIEIVNLDTWGNFAKIQEYGCIVNYRGEVKMSRKLRLSTSCSMDPALYPFDVQVCSIDLSTPGMPMSKLSLEVTKWMFKNGVQFDPKDGEKSLDYSQTDMTVLQNVFYDDNPAWNFLGYKFTDVAITGNDGNKYSRVQVTFAVARNIAFYELTLFLPIVCMCILVVLGIWMPVSSGETLGFQVTMLLTMIVYLDVLSRNGSRICASDDISIAPRLLIMFLIIAIGSVFAHIIITMNLWCHDKTSDRVFTFDRWRAKFALRCAKFFQVFKHGVYTIPTVITSLVNGEDVKDQDKDAFKEAWIFYGKICSHFWAFILSSVILISMIGIIIDMHVESSVAQANFS
ncbi:Oidioi.mRNA.OKI2018_I69.PAR.g9188.t1.cds [Oikopleura dioica]|uniref:Oidioi.mRNA.OKI2018_I69.PAR.g9188.t1.cds n=1 Tax=Oikopleura dioica TaxID=34765 RepID=A0ABN7RPU7_OIKDI|nr:Oidioi.mRNA.OKI2018_I69.PAR.g9188.t1.cds [Oikopleura dioica]